MADQLVPMLEKLDRVILNLEALNQTLSALNGKLGAAGALKNLFSRGG
jgi:hypothetical protein